MTSFVTDVLAVAGKSEKIDLNEKITNIQKEISKLKNDVKDFIDDKYIEFVSTLKKDQALVKKTEKLVEEMKVLQMRVQDQIKIELSGSTRELKDLSNALKESNLSLQLSSQLLEIAECLEMVETLKNEKKYVDAAASLQRVNILLNAPESNIRSLNIYNSIKSEYSNSYGTFRTDLILIWNRHISWKESKESNKEIVTLTIDCEFSETRDLIRALDRVEALKSCLHKFSTRLMEHFITPIIDYESSVYVVEEKIFTVENGAKKKKPKYDRVLYNLKLLFQFLNQHLDVSVANDQRFIVLLSEELLKPLSEKLIADCILDTIPSSSAELENFQVATNDINEFQDYLLKIGFLAEDQVFLSEYTKNVDNLYINKICQGLLTKARDIIRKDLHDSFRHEPQELVKFSDEILDEYDFKIDRKLSKHTFQLPPCQISKNAKEILDLGKEILEEACSSSELCAVRLFYTSRNVFELYAETVPEYHKQFLETIPEQVALFHNNCMYLAHHLLTLGHSYKNRLPEILQKHNFTYVDLTLVLRTVGSECFLNHMKYQRNIITDILRDSGLSQLGQTPELPPNTERTLRQCIRQLELLKTVWINVLPINIYCRAVGCITNSMVEDLIMKVISVEDIPADVATELVTLFNMIVKRTPSIFPDPVVIQRHVSKWSKLTELIKVLEASLKEIEDRWADGKGPLAHEFTASQVKQLIRALFQNTERRSTLLATIK